MFQVGQKVECVDDQPHPCSPYPITEITKGGIYIVSWCGSVEFDVGVTFVWLPGVRLQGIHRMHDWAWYALRFRPVVERKTDISVFQRMLTPNDEKVGA